MPADAAAAAAAGAGMGLPRGEWPREETTRGKRKLYESIANIYFHIFAHYFDHISCTYHLLWVRKG